MDVSLFPTGSITLSNVTLGEDANPVLVTDQLTARAVRQRLHGHPGQDRQLDEVVVDDGEREIVAPSGDLVLRAPWPAVLRWRPADAPWRAMVERRMQDLP